ncbi:MAG: hypothetical protein ACTSQO_03590 [Candidatus Helarchaeota archaeon]
MSKKRLSKRTKVIIGVLIGIMPLILGIFIATSGIIDIMSVLGFIISPLIIVLLLEYSVIILIIESFLFPKKWRRVLQLSALGIGVGLVSFYFYIPYMPVDMVPNHPDSGWWDHGAVVHILPAVSDNRILLKVSFMYSVSNPKLEVNGTNYVGVMTDTRGFFWMFDVKGLISNSTYELKLKDGSGTLLCDPWTLKTFPDPNSNPKNLRVLVFTGSGGNDVCRTWYGSGQMPLSVRQKLLNKALSFKPDIVIGTGDEVYYDIRYGVSSKTMGDSRRAIAYAGRFDYTKDILGTSNEIVLEKAVGPQIAYLFGTACRSIPTYFILDDHDYFANDDAIEKDSLNLQLLLAWMDPYIKACVTFPPDSFMLKLARAVQKLYLPEFLPDRNRPMDLPATNATDRAVNVSECFGTLRFGNLLEGLFYDVRRFITLTGNNATFIPPKAEKWIEDRIRSENSTYIINFSPISVGWSAGKWLSWYPDVRTKVNNIAVLTKNIPKYMWQSGWFNQHNRILNATLNLENSTPLFVCGDMHSQSAGMIVKSGNLSFSSNPIPTILTGSLGVDGGGFPSGGLRGIKATPPTDLHVIENMSSYEKAGFVIMDITQQNITINFYGWKYGTDPLSLIDMLQPHFTFVIGARK